MSTDPWGAIEELIELRREVRRDVLRDPFTYFDQGVNLFCSIVRTILIVVVIIASSHTFLMMVSVFIDPEVANRKLTDLTLGDLYSGWMRDWLIMLILMVIGFLLVGFSKLFGFRNVITERIESEVRKRNQSTEGVIQ